MRIDRFLEKNMEVFSKSHFFSQKIKKIPEEQKGGGKDCSISFVKKQNEDLGSEEQSKPKMVLYESKEENGQELVFGEEKMIQVSKTTEPQVDMRQISDELERLSHRYGRGMEEWLDDQSSL